MEEKNWQLLKDVFRQAREREPADRDAFLDEACADHPGLREQVDALLSADEDSGEFMELPSGAELLAGEEGPGAGAGRPARIGRYRLEALLSTGGMGSVYRAIQDNPRRTVAIKVMNERLASKSARRRFEYESQILARLTHPNISQVFDAGTHPSGGSNDGGLPYFVMEYIPNASSITEYIEREELSVADRLQLFLDVCDAVHYGHQKGVIHRDLKPANILVDASGRAKVIDFGVARATDADIHLTTAHTGVGQLLGTVQYMSPEQCSADPDELDTRSDVYSLGVLLYEMLCGALPYDVERIPIFEATRVIREAEPRRPSTVDRTLRGDVETIALKALEKEPDDRYQTVAEFAADIRRFLEGEVILARPAGPVTRVIKLIRRNRVLRVGVGVAALAVVSFVAYVLLVSLPQIRHERDLAKKQQKKAEAAEITALDALRDAEIQRRAAEEAEAVAEAKAALNEAINDFVREMLSAPIGPEGGRNVRVSDVLNRAAGRIEATYAGEPVVEAELRSILGDSYNSIGRYPEAESQARIALDLHTRLYGESHESTLGDRSLLGDVLIGLGRYAEAEASLRETIAEQERVLGPEHETTLHTRAILGCCLNCLKEYEEAESVLRDVREIQTRVLGEGRRHTLLSGSHLAHAVLQQGRYPEAEELAREVVQTSREHLGAEDPDTFRRMMSLAAALTEMGKRREAESIYRTIMERQLERDGVEHPMTIAATECLAVLLAKSSSLREAADLFERVVELSIRTRGPRHPVTLDFMNNLGVTLAQTGRYAEARKAFEELLELRLELQGEAHTNTIGARTNLASVLGHLGERREAERMYREILEVRERVTGPRHPHTLQVRMKLAETLTALGKDEEAEPVVRIAYEILREDFGEQNPMTLRSMLILARALHHCDRLEEADATFAEALSILERGQEPATATTANLLHYHGRTLMELERFEEAEARVLDAYDLYVDLLGERHVFTLRSIETLALLYEAWGDPQTAAEWRSELGGGQ